MVEVDHHTCTECVQRNTHVVEEETYSTDFVGYTTKEMGDATKQSVGAGTSPETGERIEVRISEIGSPSPFQSEPQHEDTERDEVCPEVPNVVVPSEYRLERISKGGVGLSVALNDVGFPVHGSHLASM